MNGYALTLVALLALAVQESAATEGITAGTALAIGIAAVLGIKLAGVAGFAIARSFGGRRRGGRRYGGHKRGYGGHRGYRGRRDVAAPLVTELEEEVMFEMIARQDVLHCGLRTICELEAKDISQLQADERIILSVFGSQPSAPSFGEVTKTALGKYQLAAFLGAEKKDVKRCGDVYKKCPFSSDQLMAAIRAADQQ